MGGDGDKSGWQGDTEGTRGHTGRVAPGITVAVSRWPRWPQCHSRGGLGGRGVTVAAVTHSFVSPPPSPHPPAKIFRV